MSVLKIFDELISAYPGEKDDCKFFISRDLYGKLINENKGILKYYRGLKLI